MRFSGHSKICSVSAHSEKELVRKITFAALTGLKKHSQIHFLSLSTASENESKSNISLTFSFNRMTFHPERIFFAYVIPTDTCFRPVIPLTLTLSQVDRLSPLALFQPINLVINSRF